VSAARGFSQTMEALQLLYARELPRHDLGIVSRRSRTTRRRSRRSSRATPRSATSRNTSTPPTRACARRRAFPFTLPSGFANFTRRRRSRSSTAPSRRASRCTARRSAAARRATRRR
jgi:hypothetical protein